MIFRPQKENKLLNVSNKSKAPEIRGIEAWFNSNPLTLNDLQGKVVIIDFWTFGCFNCRNTIPYVRELYEKFNSEGLEIIGIHTPEFDYEKDLQNIEKAIQMHDIKYPVAVDNNYETWNAYSNKYWPAFYFIDKEGYIRRSYFGEGEYQKNEQAVEKLILE